MKELKISGIVSEISDYADGIDGDDFRPFFKIEKIAEENSLVSTGNVGFATFTSRTLDTDNLKTAFQSCPGEKVVLVVSDRDSDFGDDTFHLKKSKLSSNDGSSVVNQVFVNKNLVLEITSNIPQLKELSVGKTISVEFSK